MYLRFAQWATQCGRQGSGWPQEGGSGSSAHSAAACFSGLRVDERNQLLHYRVKVDVACQT